MNLKFVKIMAIFLNCNNKKTRQNFTLTGLLSLLFCFLF